MSSIRNNFTVSTKRGGTYVVSTDPTELAVYTSVFFTEIERRFFVDNLETKSIEFSAGANCQMFCKTLIHDLSKPSNHVFPEDSGCATVPVGKETILCLHPLHKLTSSWAWIKFAVTLFRQGFNVILIDLPGFGKSSIGRDVRCPVETWRSWQVTMITLLLQKLGIPKVNILAGYESAEILFDIMHETPNLLGRNHVLYNPIIESDGDNAESLSSNMIRALLTSGLRRRVFVAFDRNQQVISDAITGTTEVDTLMVNRLLNSERLFRRISKAVGFRQVIVSSISSLDLAEMCFYDSVNQPGMRPIYAFYPSKAFRVYACQFMAGESLIEYEPAVSLPNDAVFHTTMDGATPRLSARPPKHLMSQRNSIGLPPPTARINNYSYGVRVRNMEEDLIMEIAKAESERVFLHDHDPTELRKQQKISESFTSDGFDESESRHRNLHLGKQATSTNVEHSRLLGMYASQYQQGVEELYRPYSPNTNSLYMGIMDQGGKSSPPTDTYTSSS